MFTNAFQLAMFLNTISHPTHVKMKLHLRQRGVPFHRVSQRLVAPVFAPGKGLGCREAPLSESCFKQSLTSFKTGQGGHIYCLATFLSKSHHSKLTMAMCMWAPMHRDEGGVGPCLGL